MPIKVVNSNPTTSTPNTAPLTFPAADFQQWNPTTSVIHPPAKLVGKDKIPKLRGEIVKPLAKKGCGSLGLVANQISR